MYRGNHLIYISHICFFVLQLRLTSDPPVAVGEQLQNVPTVINKILLKNKHYIKNKYSTQIEIYIMATQNEKCLMYSPFYDI